MKIAILGTRGIPNNYGGYEQLAEFLSVGLVEKGHEVIVYNNSLHQYKKKVYKGVKIITKYSPEKLLGSSANIIYDYLCLLSALKNKVDIILECGYQSSVLGFYFAPINRSIIITNMDGLDWKRSKWSPKVQKLTKWFEKLAVKKSHALIADNIGMQEYFMKEYKSKSNYIAYGTTIPNGYDIKHLKEYSIEEGNYYMLVARLEPENNIETILDGFIQSDMISPFIVVGNHITEYGEFLKNKYSQYKKIIFVGGIYNLKKLNSIRHYSKLYFHGHSVGGTNPSLLDAMACEANIVAHDNSFNKHVLNEDALYFSKPNDIAEILNNPESINQSKKESFTKNNFNKVKENYTWDKIVDDHEKLFLSLYHEKKSKKRFK